MNQLDKAGLTDILKRFGLRTSKSLGQHFLADSGVLHEIAELSGAGPDTGVLEIGPGPGVLTRALAQRAAKVLSLEVDKRLLPVLDYMLEGLGNTEIRNADALKTDFKALVSEEFSGLRPLLCANLPYNITTPLLASILAPGCFERVTVMVQREVARRLTALPGTPDYGAFTLYVQNRTRAELVFDVPPESFIPPPKVWSSVVVMNRAEPRCTHPLFERVVRAAFAQRRKQLINALPAGLPISREQAAAVLDTCGIDSRARGETLSLEDFERLALAIVSVK